jgi:DNA-directed RNA polymerase specialized sigma24 family protein
VLIEVYQQVWQQAAQFDARRSTPLAWLLMLARRRALERLRASTNRLKGKRQRFPLLSQRERTTTRANTIR